MMNASFAQMQSRTRPTLVDLLPIEPIPGRDAGVCRVCVTFTSQGHRRSPSAKFSGWAWLGDGDLFCERCWGALKDDRLRRSSWVATAERGVNFETADDRCVWRAILYPPQCPFAIYCTKGRKKQGWLSLVHAVSWSAEQFRVGTDFSDWPIVFEHSRAVEDAAVILQLRALKVPKTLIACGALSPYHTQLCLQLRTGRELLAELRKRAGSPQWEVLAYAAP